MAKSFYTHSADAWKAMLEAINHARESVYLEMYIFEDNTLGYDFVSALEMRAREGLRVVVILDALGSYNLSTETRQHLIDAGVELMFYRFWLHRTHRKMLIVDESIAFVGGMNVSGRFDGWDDLVLRVRGKVIESIVRSFARAYVLCGGLNSALTAYAHGRALERTRMWFVEHGLGGVRYILRRHYEEGIDAATRTITLVTPYFVPAGWLVAALGRALKRGVAVEIILPLYTDFRPMNHLNKYYATMLTEIGAQLYFHTTMLHAKAMLVDERIAVVGSHNLDALSFGRNVEAGVFFETPPLIHELVHILEQWKKESILQKDIVLTTHWYDRIFLWLLRLAQPVL
ncbi:MAG: phosphatidylserine/phosphatidylglycerophosphate/cardiolipin synthase family protein [Candidatus Pacebacteria bacterium]|nr:phosphatidylserine/phosphatidylglycerophosphate/cardiolipin synthase family protein [Candidatus Paceibacterota bacterium]